MIRQTPGVDKINVHYKEIEAQLRDYLTGNLAGRLDYEEELIELAEKYKETITDEEIFYVDIKQHNILKKYNDVIHGYILWLKAFDPVTYKILILFYRNGREWSEIEIITSHSKSTCKRRRDQALNKLMNLSIM